MPQFVEIRSERSLLYSPAALRLVDAFTLQQPIGRTSLVLQEEVAPDIWLNVDVTPFRSAGDVLSFPGFGRSTVIKRRRITAAANENPVEITSNNHGLADGDLVHISRVAGMTEINGRVFSVASATVDTFDLQGENGTSHAIYTGGGTWRKLRHQVLIDSDYFEPEQTGRFPVVPYNDDNPLLPGEYAQEVNQVILLPNSRYPYDSHVPLLRGRVTREADGSPVERAEIQHQSLSVFTNGDGEFTLPVRFPAQDTLTTELSELKKIKVKNARGYARAVLSVAGAEGNSYRVFEIKWKDPSAPTNYEATLTLAPHDGTADLPAALPVQSKVSLITFALLIDIPPHATAQIDQTFDVDPSSGFQQFQKIVIPSP